MSEYEAGWRFQNAHMKENGRTGIMRTRAESEEYARSQIKCAVSRYLFGTTAYQTYVNITGLAEVNSHG